MSSIRGNATNLTTQSNDQSDSEENLERFVHFINTFNGYFVIVLVLLGLFGNGFSVVVFMRCKRKDAATFQYLSLLAVTDSINLLLLALRLWLEDGLSFITDGRISIRFNLYSAAACKVERFSYHTSQFLSAWILVTFSLERCVAIIFPFSVLSDVTSKRRLRMLIALLSVAVLWNVKSLVMSTVYSEEYDPSVRVCYFDPTLMSSMNYVIFGFVHLLINTAIPCVIILIANIALSVGLWRALYRTKCLGTGMTMNYRVKAVRNLIVVSGIYVITMSPQVFTWTYYNIINLTQNFDNGLGLKTLFIIGRFGSLLSTFNYSLNFLIYNVTLDFYRNTVKDIFKNTFRCRDHDYEVGDRRTQSTSPSQTLKTDFHAVYFKRSPALVRISIIRSRPSGKHGQMKRPTSLELLSVGDSGGHI